MAKKTTISRTPAELRKAMMSAEKELKRPESGKEETIELTRAVITTRPELFQPRGFANGALDEGHVRKLAQRISTKGELSPPLLVKLGKKWVCVDGHHRLAAYGKQPGHRFDKIKCRWFAGSVSEAVDESVRRNDVTKLEMSNGDRYEAAWQRVVLSIGSKSEIVRLTGVSDGMVAQMRRVAKAHVRDNEFGRAFRAKLPALAEATWGRAKSVYRNETPAQWDVREQAALLARKLRSRLEDRLSENKQVTAMALAIYDPELPKPLARYLKNVESLLQADSDGELPAAGDTDVHNELLEDLLAEHGRLRDHQHRTAKRVEEVTRELRKRGVDTEAQRDRTPSDETWDFWTEHVSEGHTPPT
jgi:hypothetical protein